MNNHIKKHVRWLTINISIILLITCIPFSANSQNCISPIYAEENIDQTTDSGIESPDDFDNKDTQDDNKDKTQEDIKSDEKPSEAAIQNEASSVEPASAKVSVLEANTDWYNSSGNSFTLDSAEDLQGLSKLVNDGTDSFQGKKIKLARNLGPDELTITPIGTVSNPFAGEFDGDGHTLSGLELVTKSKKYIGLFGFTATGSAITNLDIRGNLKVEEDNKSGEQIRYVGAIAGYMNGDLKNCESEMNIAISSNLTLGENQGIIRNVGGLVGLINGDMKNCSNVGADITISSASDVNEDIIFLIGEIGGVAGTQGSVKDTTNLYETDNCSNSGKLMISLTGKGDTDRFGDQMYSVSFAVGGVIGQATSVVKNCNNTSTINTSTISEENSRGGFGASNTGGIVGNLRGDTFDYNASKDAQHNNYSKIDPAYEYYQNQINANSSTPKSPIAGVYNCKNTANIIGLAHVGGIVGGAGTFTEIEGSSNTGDIKGTRWNKPFTAGINGDTQGDIRYCFNRGNIYSTSGAGYYCAGIAGGLWVPYTSATAEKYKFNPSEMTGCYTTGYIRNEVKGYRSGILVGENEGYIHDNVYIQKLSIDNVVVAQDSGITVNNTEFASAEKLKEESSKARGLLNVYASTKGNWKNCYLPAVGGENNGFPILSSGNMNVESATSIPNSALVELKDDASYVPIGTPAPSISVKVGNKVLVQNSDFYVKLTDGSTGVTIGKGSDTRPYDAVIVGMGEYKGDYKTISYGIKQAPIRTCTIVANTSTFNWLIQRPNKNNVKIYDSANNEIDSNDYEVSDAYDVKKGNKEYKVKNPVTGAIESRYYDYKNVHSRNYKYDVVVTAKETSNYQGVTTQQAFRIDPVSMSPNIENPDPNKPEAVSYGAIKCNGKTWDFAKAQKDTSGNYIKIPYTGKPIKPTVTKVTYLGKSLTLATNKDYLENPLKYDYRYVYGNPNPELIDVTSHNPTNVTKAGSPTCMTLRYTNGGNFHNNENIFYHIIPADMKSFSASASSQQYSGRTLKPKPQIKWNGMVLKEGRDYTLSGLKYSANKSIGKARMTFSVTGQRNLKGKYQKTILFNILPKKMKVSKLTPSKKSLKVKFKKASKKQGITSYQIRYKIKGKSKWKTKKISSKKGSVTIKRLKKGKRYQVQIRSVKRIKKGSSKGTYYSSWSSTKTSKKIK